MQEMFYLMYILWTKTYWDRVKIVGNRNNVMQHTFKILWTTFIHIQHQIFDLLYKPVLIFRQANMELTVSIFPFSFHRILRALSIRFSSLQQDLSQSVKSQHNAHLMSFAANGVQRNTASKELTLMRRQVNYILSTASCGYDHDK